MKSLALGLSIFLVSFNAVQATSMREDHNETIYKFCENRSIVGLAQFGSQILGDVSLFYDCTEKEIHMISNDGLVSDVKFNIAANPDMELYFYPQSQRDVNERNNRIAIVLSEKPTIEIKMNGMKEVVSINTRRSVISSAYNFPFLISIINVPGWGAIDDSDPAIYSK